MRRPPTGPKVLVALGVALLLAGSWWGLTKAPGEVYMGEVQRIMYVHVPTAWNRMLAVVFAFVLHRTWVGRQLYAAGKNSEAARFAGVRVARLKTTLFVVSGVISALAGVILTGRLASSRADNGQGFVLDVVTAVLLGGVNIFGGEGTIAGVVLAVFTIGVLRNALTLADVTPDTQATAVGALLIVSVAGPNVVRRIRAAWSRRGRPPQTVSGR